jgi:pimeloyl-ACP methyl ester carboxylesterase/membrane protein DedA with SNARE-associated domain
MVLGVGVYGLLLGASFIVRASRQFVADADPLDGVAVTQAVDGNRLTSAQVRIVYREYAPSSGQPSKTIVLLHGSPGQKEDFRALAPVLAQHLRVVVPDLPGFGSSTRVLSDYSFKAHALYVRQLLDQLGLERAHVLGFSMGGGVALSLVDLAPNRVASLTMLSAIGIQEMELTGDYYVNHAVHGVQLVALWLLREGTPHLGRLDDVMLGVPYARNFFDSDQRPLRHILQREIVPTLIVHGIEDNRVPIEAADEHHRLVPQSELLALEGDHFLLFTSAAYLGDSIGDFVVRAEQGQAPGRADADPARVRVASRAFVAGPLPRARGIAAAVFRALLTTAAACSESVAVVAAGALVARGRVSPALAVGACFTGMSVAQWLLFLGTRRYGRRILHGWPMRWLFPPAAVERSLALLVERDDTTRQLQSLVLGKRRTTVVGAGLLNVGLWKFSVLLLLANAMWTTAAIAVSALVTSMLLSSSPMSLASLDARTASVVVTVACLLGIIQRAATAKGRRLLVSSWRRCTRWEFWPPSVFYPPVLVYLASLMLKHRSATLFTAANPAIVAGGFVGESKYAILQGLAGAHTYLARSHLIAGNLSQAAKVRDARRFMANEALSFPIVLKPNHGQRGSGVVVVRSPNALEDCLERSSVDTIIQEYVGGAEFGVFYYRRPSEARGHIFSVTEKRFPTVTGDGRHTLEDLILHDDRAVCAARLYCERHRDRLLQIPVIGESIPLAELGTHCRGAVFLDGRGMLTPALEERFDTIARGFTGFYFGRFDVRAADGIQAFREGYGFKIIELNGVTSEATHIYHPGTPLTAAYRVLMEQWRLAFEIGAENRRRGVDPTPVRVLVELTREYRQTARAHLSERAGGSSLPIPELGVPNPLV